MGGRRGKGHSQENASGFVKYKSEKCLTLMKKKMEIYVNFKKLPKLFGLVLSHEKGKHKDFSTFRVFTDISETLTQPRLHCLALPILADFKDSFFHR